MFLIDYSLYQMTCVQSLAAAGTASTLRKRGSASGDAWDPTFGADSDTAITTLEYRPSIRDNNGDLVYDDSYRVLVKYDSTVVINAEDRIAIGVAPASVVSSTPFNEIRDVQLFNPGGTPLFWELELAS